MIKKYSDAKAEKAISYVKEALPAGGYVAVIKKASVIGSDYGDRLELAFDIAEGEHKGFFTADYKNNPNEDRKWRGSFRLRIPDESNTEQNGWSKRAFNQFIYAVEESNNGYHFDWDETHLKDKLIGVLFRNKEWEFAGKTGWTTECCSVADVDTVRNNKFRMPKDKPLPKQETKAATFTAPVAEDDDGLPF